MMLVMKQQLDGFIVAARLEKQAALRQWCAPQSIFPSNPKLSQVFHFIETHYHQSITLCDVAKAVGYSGAYLTDLVRRQTGKTVNHWIVDRRIAEACCLLLETDQTVHEIAEAVGYQNVGHFFRQFRQRHGTTPQAWRKSHQLITCTILNQPFMGQARCLPHKKNLCLWDGHPARPATGARRPMSIAHSKE